MELSLFLAKLFGLYMILVAVIWILRGRVVTDAIEAFFANPGLMFFGGLIAMVAGLAIAIGHPVWELNFRGAITVMGYLSIAKGISRMAFPDSPRAALRRLLEGRAKWVMVVLTLVIGSWLTWRGFGG